LLSEIICRGYVRRAYISVSGQIAPIPRRDAVIARVENKMGAYWRTSNRTDRQRGSD
jgi:hypothetical protein